MENNETVNQYCNEGGKIVIILLLFISNYNTNIKLQYDFK